MPLTIEHRPVELLTLHEEVRIQREKNKRAHDQRKRTQKAKDKPRQQANTTKHKSNGHDAYATKALQDEVDNVASASNGARNTQLNSSAFSLGQLVGGGVLDRNQVERQLTAAATDVGLDDSEIEKTLQSGLEAGIQQPRTAPEREYKTGYQLEEEALNIINGEGEEPTTELPYVVIAGQMRDYIQASVNALKQREEQAPTLFVQSARLVKIGHDEKKRPIIMHVGVAELRNALTQSANFYRVKQKGDEQELVSTSPPKELAEQILALEPREWPFPALDAIVETPVLRPDGTILDKPGYDAATHLYYLPQEELKEQLQRCKVPEHPTLEDAKQALALIDEALGEFPYATPADKANGYAAYMTAPIRPAIKRHIPMGLTDAPKQGTGKGLFVDTLSITATGKPASILTAPDNDDEWDKRITAMLMQGRSIICIDNIVGKLQSAALDGTLTADVKEGRILGLSKMVQVPNRAVWMATGNNIRLGGDLPRRCYRIRLDPKVSRPWMRTGFKHEDLATWVQENRGRLVVAVLTIARAWFLAGQPKDAQVPTLGTFTPWAATMGGILKFVGIQDFLGNLEKLYEESDEDSAQWEAFLNAWRSLYDDAWITTKQLVEKIQSDEENNTLAPALPETLQFALKEKPNSFSIRLGKAFETKVDTCYGIDNLHIERDKDKHTKQKIWRVAGSGPTTTRNDETAPRANSQIFAGSAGSQTTYAHGENFSSAMDSTNNTTMQNKTDNGWNNYPHYPQGENSNHSSNGSTSHSNGQKQNAGSEATTRTLPAKIEELRQYWQTHNTQKAEWTTELYEAGAARGVFYSTGMLATETILDLLSDLTALGSRQRNAVLLYINKALGVQA